MDTDEHWRAFSGLSNLNRARVVSCRWFPPLFRFPVQMSNRLGESKEAPYDQFVFQTRCLAFSPCHIFHRMHRRAASTLSGQLHRHMKQNDFANNSRVFRDCRHLLPVYYRGRRKKTFSFTGRQQFRRCECVSCSSGGAWRARYELLPSKASLPQWMTRQRHSPLLEKKRRIRSRSPIRLSLPKVVSPPR